MKNIFIFIFFLIRFNSSAQVFLTDFSNQIYQLNPLSCQVEFLFKVAIGDTLQDLAIWSDGYLYGISNHGDLYQINPETEDVLLIHSFLNLQTFQALNVSTEGQLFVSGSEGFLYLFEITDKSERFVGDIGSSSIEDLIEYHGDLYASTTQKKLLHINLSDPSQSEEILDLGSISALKGLYNSENLDAPCEVLSMFGISAIGKVYEFDPKLREAKEICDLGLNISGAASSLDRLNFAPLTIKGIISHPSQCLVDNGQVVIHASGGIGRLLFSIDDGEYLPDSFQLNLAPGNYTMQVRDENNCIVSQEIEIESTREPVIRDIVLHKPLCLDGKGSVSVRAEGYAPLKYSLDGTHYQTSQDFSDVASGIYSIWVKDSNDCQVMSEINLIPDDLFKIQKIRTNAATCDSENGSIEINLSAENDDITYQLDDYLQSTSLFENLAAGLHHLTVTQGTSCRIDTVIPVNYERCGIFVPSAFSPDHDGINDDFRIYTDAQNQVSVKSYQIFDRWGGKIYEATNFSIHEENHWWDGHANKSNITQGLYVYLIEITYPDGTVEFLQGQVSIL